MDNKQISDYLLSLKRELNDSGYYVYKLSSTDRILIQKSHGRKAAYLEVLVERDGALIINTEGCKREPLDKIQVNLHVGIQIQEPHHYNLVQIANLYFEHGRGAHLHNPSIKKLINATGNRTKSARNI